MNMAKLTYAYTKEGNSDPRLGRVRDGLGFPAGAVVEVLGPACMSVSPQTRTALSYTVTGQGYRHTTGTEWMEQATIEMDVPASFLVPT